jgi:hypothetical protein
MNDSYIKTSENIIIERIHLKAADLELLIDTSFPYLCSNQFGKAYTMPICTNLDTSLHMDK